MRRTAYAVGTAGLMLAALVPAGAVAARPSKLVGPGCDPSRPAVAHYANGRVLKPQPATGPVPCGVTTGYGGAESHLVVTNTGAVIYAPAALPSGALGTGEGPDLYPSQTNAVPAALARSADNGATWSLVKPYGATWNPTDHSSYVDRATGRFFFENYGPIPLAPQLGLGGGQQEGPAHMMWTGDEGKTWHHTAIQQVALPENPRFTSARPPTGQPRPTGYPNVVYFCANTNVGFYSPVIGSRLCFRSLDGGDTWVQASVLFTGGAPQHAECGGQPEVYSAVDGYYPQPARDGSLYVMVSCGGKTYLARSADEAATFPVLRVGADHHPLTLPVPPGAIGSLGSPELRIDPDDTMFVAYDKTVESRSLLLLRVSRDHGRTWSGELNMTAPGVTGVYQWVLAARGRGHVAVGYLAHKKGQATYDGYVTETTNATAARPVFWSAVTNDPKRPILFGPGIQGSGYVTGPLNIQVLPPFPLSGAGSDFIGADIGPDGTPWVSFNQDCGPDPKSAGCVQQKDQTRGFVGRLRRSTATGEGTGGPGGSGTPGGAPGDLPTTGGLDGIAWGALGMLVIAGLVRVRRLRGR